MALLWDNRVWMAHRGLWPSAADRFASDLGWAEQVNHPDLAALTRALHGARIPILTGGHSLVSGSLLALLESLPPAGRRLNGAWDRRENQQGRSHRLRPLLEACASPGYQPSRYGTHSWLPRRWEANR